MIKFIEKREVIHKPIKNIVVLYHLDCTDGFSAAWAAWKKFGDKADYIGIDPGTKPVEGLVNKEIYMVDVIYPAQYLKKLINSNKKIVAIDHHFSNQGSFKIISNGLFDLNNSGAVLAWKYFHPRTKVPKFLQHVEDMDLWKFKVPDTKEIISYLDTVDFNFAEWSKISNNINTESKFKEYVKLGSLILKYQDKVIERIISNHAKLVKFFGYNVYAVNSPIFNSQIANVLYKTHPPIGIVWSEDKNGRVHVSLRSNGSVDVSRLAARFKGGGGHKESAGFSVESCSILPWKNL